MAARAFKILLLFMALFLQTPLQAWADPSPSEEMFIFHLGYFLPSFDTKLRIDNSQLGRGDEVNLEKDLGLDVEETTIRGDVMWRMSEHNKLTLGVFHLNRNGTKVLNRQIQIGDQIYPVGATVNNNFNFTVVPISWSYAFIKKPTWEVSAGAGLQWSSINFRIDGSASLSGISNSREARASANAPLPLLGIDAKYYIFPSWSVGSNLGVFAYKVGAANMTMQGNIVNATVSTDWWFSTYVGAGFAVNWFYVGVDVSSGPWTGDFNYQYLGPQLYLSGRF
ncbi:MAG: hypothetical protein J7501_11595 [Bdellovibrio sp.]|nr:hypothetical protein [Bdellovibrio sp.]